jgi:hypothetical protein
MRSRHLKVNPIVFSVVDIEYLNLGIIPYGHYMPEASEKSLSDCLATLDANEQIKMKRKFRKLLKKAMKKHKVKKNETLKFTRKQMIVHSYIWRKCIDRGILDNDIWI